MHYVLCECHISLESQSWARSSFARWGTRFAAYSGSKMPTQLVEPRQQWRELVWAWLLKPWNYLFYPFFSPRCGTMTEPISDCTGLYRTPKLCFNQPCLGFLLARFPLFGFEVKGPFWLNKSLIPAVSVPSKLKVLCHDASTDLVWEVTTWTCQRHRTMPWQLLGEKQLGIGRQGFPGWPLVEDLRGFSLSL